MSTGEEYFTLNGTSDTQNYDLFITQWSRRCGWEDFASLLLLIDTYLETARSLLLQLSLCLWIRSHWYASSLTLTDHGDSFMNRPWCWVWCYGRYATGWKMSSGNVVLNLISNLLYPTLLSRPDTNQACCTALQACSGGPEPTYTQPSNTSFNKPTWTVSLLLWDKLFLMEFTKNAVCGPTANHVDHRLEINLLSKQFVCPVKFLLMKRNVRLTPSPRQSSRHICGSVS